MTLDGAFADNVAATSGGVFAGHYTCIGGFRHHGLANLYWACVWEGSGQWC